MTQASLISGACSEQATNHDDLTDMSHSKRFGDPDNPMTRNFSLGCIVAILLCLPSAAGCGSDENRVVIGVAPEYQMRADAQAEYEKAMQEASKKKR